MDEWREGDEDGGGGVLGAEVVTMWCAVLGEEDEG